MPTPLVYQAPEGRTLFGRPSSESPAIDPLHVTDRVKPTADEDTSLASGETRGRRVAFGPATARMAPTDWSWQDIETQSTLGERTRPITLEMGAVTELADNPSEPYDFELLPNGKVIRRPEIQARHDQASSVLGAELDRWLAASPTKKVVLCVHGFNETFASGAYSMAGLCHFLGRESVCAFFSWLASHTGNFLISCTNSVESAAYALPHLKKALRLIATRPDVRLVYVLAHNRGTAVAMDAVHQLLVESIAAEKEPIDTLKLGELVLFFPDIDMDIAAQRITGYVILDTAVDRSKRDATLGK